MGWRTTAALFLLVAGLLALLWFTQERPSDRGNVDVLLLDGRRLHQCKRMRWQFTERAPVELERRSDAFWLAEPIVDLASVAHLTSIATAWDSAKIGETPLADTPENRSATGLASPRLVVDIDFDDGALHVEFGAEGPLGIDLFVRRGDRIWRGGLALLTALDVGVDDLRERQVFRTPLADEVVVDRAQGDGSREVLRLQRGGGGWQLVEPIRARADIAAASAFVGNILAMRIDAFAAGVLRLPDGEPDLVLTVRGGPAEEVVKFWLDPQQNLQGRLDDRRISFTTAYQQYKRTFAETADALRSRILVDLEDLYHELLTMMVDPGGAEPRLVLHRETADSAWQLQEPVAGAAEPEAVNQLLTAINNLRAVAFLRGDATQFGLQPGALAVGTQGVTAPKAAWVRLGSDATHNGMEVTYAARTDAPDEVVAVPRAAASVIRRPWVAYVPRAILGVQDAVTRLDLSRRDGAARSFVRKSGQPWTADASGPGLPDAVVADIVDHLRDLQGKRVLLSKSLDLGEPDWSLAMGRSEDPPDAVGFGALEVWQRGQEPLLVRSRTGLTQVVYELSPLDSDMLRRLWP